MKQKKQIDFGLLDVKNQAVVVFVLGSFIVVLVLALSLEQIPEIEIDLQRMWVCFTELFLILHCPILYFHNYGGC